MNYDKLHICFPKFMQHTFTIIVHFCNHARCQPLFQGPHRENLWCHDCPKHQLQSSKCCHEPSFPRWKVWMDGNPCTYNGGRDTCPHDVEQSSFRTAVHACCWFSLFKNLCKSGLCELMTDNEQQHLNDSEADHLVLQNRLWKTSGFYTFILVLKPKLTGSSPSGPQFCSPPWNLNEIAISLSHPCYCCMGAIS